MKHDNGGAKVVVMAPRFDQELEDDMVLLSLTNFH
jgi:hypothetical protein